MQNRLRIISTIGLFVFPVMAALLYWFSILPFWKCLAVVLYGILLYHSCRLSLIEINWNPSRKVLRDFGLIGLVVCPILGGVIYCFAHFGIIHRFAHLSDGACLVITAIGVILFAVSRLSLTLTRWIFIGLTLAAAPIGFGVGVVVLGIVFFGLLTPVGLAFRLAGRDPLRLRREPNRTSNWQSHTPIDDTKRYFRQF
jgi:hypothetical protein